MFHSITFGNKNTWDAWHIVPESRPVIVLPEVRTNYISIPGMDGALDYTEALSGDTKYDTRNGSWKFYVMNDYGQPNYDFNAWNELYQEIAAHLHGKKMLIWSEDDPEYVYEGRFSVGWSSEKDWSKITINYILDPYKMKGYVDPEKGVVKDTKKSTANADWLWDDLMTYTNKKPILYGKFDVNEPYDKNGDMIGKTRTFVNNTDSEIELSVKTSSNIVVSFDGKEYEFEAGRHRESGLILAPNSKNKMTFYGSAQITIDYDKYGEML